MLPSLYKLESLMLTFQDCFKRAVVWVVELVAGILKHEENVCIKAYFCIRKYNFVFYIRVLSHFSSPHEWTHPWEIQIIWQKPAMISIINVEILETLPLKSRTRQRCLPLLLLFSCILTVLVSPGWQEQELKSMRFERENENCNYYRETLKRCTGKLLQLIRIIKQEYCIEINIQNNKISYSSNSKMWFLNVKITLTNPRIEGNVLKLIKKV